MVSKKIITLSLILLLSNLVLSQTSLKGKIFDSETGEPLPFVNVVFNAKGNGFTSNLDGDFKITTTETVSWLKVSYLGYLPKTIELTSENINKPFRIGLTKTIYNINEVIVKPGINPAHRIINSVYENRDKNNPEKLESFRYTSYNKLYFTIDKLNTKKLKVVGVDTTKSIDSLTIKLEKFKEKQHLMMFEAVSKRDFQYPNKNREEIIASRVSGLKDPFITFLATQFQSFSFYPQLITLADKAYLNPISPGSTSKYLFILEDTFFNPENDTLFIVSFRPRKNRNFDGLMGQLTINSNGYAIQSVIAEPSEEKGMISIKIQQRYERIKETWFPVELNTDLSLTSKTFDSRTKKTITVEMLGVGKSYLKDIEINPNIRSGNFSHVEATFDPQAGERNTEYWNLYRRDSLTAKELRTYKVIDSLGKKANLDKKMRLIESMISGKIPFGYVSLNINQLIGYNQYEGTRMGLGLETNQKVSKFFKVGGYTAYGFKDKKYKYGGFSEITFNKKYEVNINYSYKKDVLESGSYGFGGEISTMLGSDFYRMITVAKMDGIDEHRAGFGFRFLKSFKLNLSVANQKYDLLSGYFYKEANLTDTLKGFNQSEFKATLRFAPGEKFMETPAGIIPLNQDFPVLWVNYIKGLNLFDSRFEYEKLELKLDKSFRWRMLGKTSVSIGAGKVFGNVPIPIMYFGRANYLEVSVDVNHCFGAMRMNEFIADRFINIFLKHDFGKLLWRNKSGKWQPEFAIAQNISFGDMSSNTMHIVPANYIIKSPTKGYYETGLLINKLLTNGYMAYGFGVYYRYGAYSFTDNPDNFAYKMTMTYAF
ncbi:MAG: DUF5686 family protein [Tenuifilaceae bacterium]